MKIDNGIVEGARFVETTHFDTRSQGDVRLLVIHNISLPPGQFGGNAIEALFTGQLDPNAHPFFEQIYTLRVSSHLLVRRDGEVVQFVNLNDRAWHAGVSSFQGEAACNDFSIGIELEGTDSSPYTNEQYAALVALTVSIQSTYPAITLGRIVGHCDIAPGRKTDPGPAFDWARYRQSICADEFKTGEKTL